jgi:hypothetical protein
LTPEQTLRLTNTSVPDYCAADRQDRRASR